MLRDLDSRRTAGTVPAPTPQSGSGIERDTLILNDSEATAPKPGLPGWTLLIAASFVLLAAAIGVWWYLNNSVMPTRKATPAQLAPKAAPATPVLAVAPAATPSVAASGAASAPVLA